MGERKHFEFSKCVKVFIRLYAVSLRRTRFLVISSVCLTVLSGLIPSMTVYLLQEIMNGIQEKSMSIKMLLICFALYTVLGFITIVLSGLQSIVGIKMSNKVDLQLNQIVIDKIASFELQNFEDSQVNDLIERAKSQLSGQAYTFYSNILSSIQAIILAVSNLYVAIIMNAKYIQFGIIIFTIALHCILILKVSEFQYSVLLDQTQSKRKSLYYLYLLTSDSAFKELKLFKAQESIKDGFLRLIRGFNNQAEKIQWRYVLCDGIMSMIEQGMIAFTYFNSLVTVLVGKELLGTCVAFINSIENVKSGIQQLFTKGVSIVEQAYYLNFIFELIDYRIVLTKSDNSITINHIESIEFVHVGFKYPSKEVEALHDVNIVLRPGCPFIIVGANGSGKSTFLKLLGGYYLNYTGTILVNGYDFKAINIEDYREKLSILFQDFSKYEMSAMENINIGQTGAKKSVDEIKLSMKKYKLPDNISNNPNQQIGYWFENGVQLSGGQWQRLAICRTMVRDNEILLMDEPNAALDAISFGTLYEEISDWSKNKVCVILLQHFSNVVGKNEEICVFDNGKLIAHGKHDILYKKCDTYKKLYDAQQ